MVDSAAAVQKKGWFGRASGATHPPTLGKQLLHCLIALGLATGSYFAVSHFMFQSVVVDGDSMKPTLHNADRYVMNRVEYYFRTPKPEDIVVLRDPIDGMLVVKRIIAVQGENVELSDGGVFVDGVRLAEPYLPKGTRTYSFKVRDHEKFVCRDNEFFVLGDNRGNSADSRVYGVVPRKNILGVVTP